MEALAKFYLLSLWVVLAQFVSSQDTKGGNPVDKISPSQIDQQSRLWGWLVMDLNFERQSFPPDVTSYAEKVSYLSRLEQHSTILEKAGDLVNAVNVSQWKYNEAPLVSQNPSSADFRRVEDSIHKILKYFATQQGELNDVNVALGLAWTKIYDDKHGGNLQKKYALDDWTNEICTHQINPSRKTACRVIQEDLKLRKTARFPESILQESGKSLKAEMVGNEKDTIKGSFNPICQEDLLLRCAMSEECVAKYFDPEPQSQYMLSHQLLQRILTESSKCSSMKQHLNEDVNHRLCAKMYAEAQLVSHLGYPESLRDIFAENVGLCGYMGYPNFFRSDWLQNILSWQSKSEYGCFVHAKNYDEKYFTTDVPLKRKQTQKELSEGVTTEELCRPHLTSVNLIALMGFWDYMQDK